MTLDDDPWYATDAEEHREWHRINGPPETTVCPWDCYDPPEPDHCPACGAYVRDDGMCPEADTPGHVEKMAEFLSEELAAGLSANAPRPRRATISGSESETENSALGV